MSKLLRQMAFSAAVGFIIPSLGFSLAAKSSTLTPASSEQPKYLFEVSYDDAEGAIGFALTSKGAGQKVSAVISGRKNTPVFSYSRPITVEIRSLKFDKAAGRWSANLLAMDDKNVITAVPVAGRFEENMEVPVLKKQIRSGETISAEDIEIRDFPISNTRAGTVTDMSSLIGKSPVHTISPNRPIREKEIELPAIIKKNDLVQMRYKSGSMEITTTGEALGDGARGATIEVRNTVSHKTVRAVVQDAGTVSVMPVTTQTTMLSGVSSHETN